MNEGLLWLDADPKRALQEKVAQAAERYRRKYGCKPNLCYVNPIHLAGVAAEYGGVRVEPMRNVLKYHFWIGVEST